MPRTPAEIGRPGLPLFSGRLSLETNTRLRWPYAGKIYRNMLNDEPAAAALWTAVRTLLRTDMQVSEGSDPRAQELVQSSLEDMRESLSTKLRQQASAFFYGFDIHEIVYKRRPDGLVGWADWAIRRQDSFERWEEDKNGRVVAFTQRPAPTYKICTIPLKKCIHLIADDSEGSPEGRGALRPMYRYWYMVTQFELLAGIALERFGTGMPVFSRDDKQPSIKLTAAQEAALGDIAAGVRQNEFAYVLEPPGIRFRFEPSPGIDAASYLAFIQNFRTWMLSTSLAEFIAMGTANTGSLARSQSEISLFLRALTGLQDKICDAINRQAISPLMRYNGWGELEEMPKVSLPAVREYDLAALGGFAKALQSIGSFHPTPQDEEWFRKISDLVDVPIEDIEQAFEDEEAEKEEQKRQALAALQEQPDTQEEEPPNGKEEEPIEEMEEMDA